MAKTTTLIDKDIIIHEMGYLGKGRRRRVLLIKSVIKSKPGRTTTEQPHRNRHTRAALVRAQ
jgi:hypothetical protein